jgi:hypothetical protein
MPMPPDWSSADVAAIERAAFGQLVIADVEWDHPDPSEPDSGEPRWIMEIRSRDGARGFSRHNTHEQALEHRDKILTEAEWQGRAGISTWLSRMTTDDSG